MGNAEVLLEFIDSLGSSLDCQQIMKNAAAFFVQKLRLSNCSLVLGDKKVQHIADKKYDALEDEVAKQIQETKSAMFIEDIEKDFLVGGHAKEIQGAIAAFPLNVNGKTGTAILYSEENLEPKAELAASLSERLAKALSNANLFSEAQHCAITDMLTGLYNKAYFTEALKNEIAKAERFKRPTSLIIFDFDNFKEYNDTKGHPEGDLLLEETGKILREGTKQSDIASRYGGEEFAIILPETMPEQAKDVAERLRKQIEEKFNMETTVSLGICGCLNSSVSPKIMLSEADKALYRAKALGKNRTISRIIVDKALGVVEA